MLSDRPIQMLIGVVIGTGLIFGLTWLMLYLNRRGIKTHPNQKIESRYRQKGRAKAERRRNIRRFRF